MNTKQSNPIARARLRGRPREALKTPPLNVAHDASAAPNPDPKQAPSELPNDTRNCSQPNALSDARVASLEEWLDATCRELHKVPHEKLAELSAWLLHAIPRRRAAEIPQRLKEVLSAQALQLPGMLANRARVAALGRARQVAVERARGLSPQQVGAKQQAKVLMWLYRWGWSSASILDKVHGRARPGYAASLVRKRLIAQHPSPAPGGIAGMPRKILTLTREGLAVLQAHRELVEDDPGLLDQYPRAPFAAIKFTQLRHDFLVQRRTAEMLTTGLITAYKTPRELESGSQSGVKQPDAAWLGRGQEGWTAYELELSPKRGRELDQTLTRILDMVRPEGEPGAAAGPYIRVLIESPSQAILERYRARLVPGKKIQKYQRGANRIGWIALAGATVEVKRWVTGRVQIRAVSLAPAQGRVQP